MADHVIYISSAGLIWYQRYRQRLDELMHCNDVSTAAAQLRTHIANYGVKPVTVLLDVLEESYVLESIPHLNSRDREALLERKKNQLFPKARFNYCAVRGRDKTGRRDDQVFFSAITDEHVIQPWLKLLFDLQIPLSTIQSLPILSEKLVKDLAGGDHKLLIDITENHLGVALRQSFFKNNILALSRFRQLKTSHASEFVATVKEEVDRSRRFVSRQFNLTPSDLIYAHFFYSGTITYELFQTIDFSGMNLETRFYRSCDYALSQGLTLSDNSGINQILAAQQPKMLAVKHYQDQQSLYYYKHHQLKKMLNAISTLMLLGTVIYSVFAVAENARLNISIEQLHNELRTLSERMSQTFDAPLINNFNPFEIRAQIHVVEQLQNQIITPTALLTPVSEILQKYPNIVLKTVSWGIKDDANQAQETESSDPAQLSDNGHRRVTLNLNAQIMPFDGNYRKALALIERIAKEFEQGLQIRNVKIAKRPIEISTNNELSGTISQPTRDSEFRLEMQWEHL